jgi:hypothetical protein
MNENMCLASGCEHICCQNPCLPMTYGEFARFKEGLETLGVDPIRISLRTLHALYFTRDSIYPVSYADVNDYSDTPWEMEVGEEILVYVQGPCPALDPASGCMWWSESLYRPFVCWNVKRGSPYCNMKRVKAGLPELPVSED